MMHYHDTHFHLDLSTAPEDIANQIEKEGVYTIAVTNSPSVFFYTAKITSNRKFLRAALGLHPELANERHYEFDQFLDLSRETRYIGEVGLDNSHKTTDDYIAQKRVFEKIISACASQGGKILTVHSRKATSDVIDIIASGFPGKIILHWYSGGQRDLDRAIENGYYFSINYPMTISGSGIALIQRVPLDKILIESDGPFTTCKGIPCTPMASRLIVDQIIKLRINDSSSKELIQNAIFENFKAIIR